MLHWFDVSDGVSDCVSARNEQTGDEKRKQGVLGLVGELEMVLICACEFLDSGMADRHKTDRCERKIRTM